MTFPKFHDLRSRLAEVARRADEQTPESIRATVAFVLDSLDQAAGRAQAPGMQDGQSTTHHEKERHQR